MKKIIEKDKQIRLKVKLLEKKRFVLNSIFTNFNFILTTRWIAYTKLKKLINLSNSKVSLTNKCLVSVNKKRFNKFSYFSRQIYLKLIRSGEIYGIKKSVW